MKAAAASNGWARVDPMALCRQFGLYKEPEGYTEDED